ncbi:unnamed protein product [Orchesella dallaii]|uniref:DOMON domain-containing protein n=1 Tax=Orchesella dallaii TaxID=48710 RepID=A0ABP1S7I7_9HEXA
MERIFVTGTNFQFFILLLVFANGLLVLGQNIPSHSSQSSLTFHQREVLDNSTGLSLEWNLSLESKTILFTIETLRGSAEGNHVALGLTKKGRVEQGADVILIGIGSNSRPFVNDMVASNGRTVVQDRNQNWILLDSQRLATGGSRVTIQRGFDACDEQDMPFNSDLIHLVWGYGSTSSSGTQTEISWRNESRPIYFVDPIVVTPPPQEDETIQTFRVSRKMLVPARHTSYWCSLHKLNTTLNQKHHIVGFAPYFPSDLGRKHVHHQIIYRCIAPANSDPEKLFEPFVNQPGEECYINNNTQLPRSYCAEHIHEWAVGGKDVPFPDNVGFALGGESSPIEYFLYETHYDNPEVRDDLYLETGVDFAYSSRLKENEGGIMLIGHGPFGQWVMPPMTSEFDLAGNCNPTCTTRMFPPEGVEILVARLHAHLSSRRIRIKHFRNGIELPWILNDDNYDFNFQQWRPLYNPVRILPGDQITVRCGYDNTWKNDSSATVSGYSTRDEMCVGWLLINKRLDYAHCMSEYPTEKTLARFGIQNMTWDLDLHDRIIHSATNAQNVGLTFTQLVTNVLSNYTLEQRRALEEEQLYSIHGQSCPNFISGGRILHYLSLIQQELPDGVELPLPAMFRDLQISDRTIKMPAISSAARYPREVPEYQPEISCPAPRSVVTAEGSGDGEMPPVLPSSSAASGGVQPPIRNRDGRFNRPTQYSFRRKSSFWGVPEQFSAPIRGNQPQAGSSSKWNRQSEVLNVTSRLTLEWNVNLESRTLLFTVSTSNNITSCVAFGLKKKGRLEEGDDVIVIGVGANGSASVGDMVATNGTTVIRDRSQDCELMKSNGSSFSIRQTLEACDKQEYSFNVSY